jgi:hypothetical protein
MFTPRVYLAARHNFIALSFCIRFRRFVSASTPKIMPHRLKILDCSQQISERCLYCLRHIILVASAETDSWGYVNINIFPLITL